MKNKKMLQNVGIMLAVQVIAWAGFTVVDFVEETTSNDFLMAAALGIPIIAAVVYCFMRWRNWQPDTRCGKWIALTLLCWLGMTACAAVIVMVLINHDSWIVHQDREGWEHFLNGLEYAGFGATLAVIPIVLVLAGELLIWGIMKSKRKSPAHNAAGIFFFMTIG